MSEQGTLEWHRMRLGKFTGSNIHKLMGKARNKNDIFSQTALTYIKEVAAERCLNQEVVDDDMMFEEYVNHTQASGRAIAWGQMYEAFARADYEFTSGNKVEAVSSIPYEDMPYFASSPDGVVVGEEKGCIEIKCPTLPVFIEYANEIKDNDTLLVTKPEYYWQCMAHMMCVGAQWCDFIAYHPYATKQMVVVRITRDENAVNALKEKLILAEDEVIKITKKFNENGN